jgi:methyl-accepting chemotaxis protein
MLLRQRFNAPVRWFARIPWPLGRKIQVILVALMLVVFLTGSASVLLLFNLKSQHQVEHEGANLVQSGNNLNELVNVELRVYGDAVLVNRQSFFDTYTPDIKVSLVQINQLPVQDDQGGQLIKSQLKALTQLYPQVSNTLQTINALLSNDQPDDARVMWQQNNAQETQLKTNIDELKRLILVEQNTLDQNVEANIIDTIGITIGLIFFTLLLLGAIAFLLTYTLGGAMGQLKKDLAIVASGELNIELKTSHRDEIGEVVSVFNRALGLLRQVIGSSAIGREVTGLAERLAVASKQQASLAQGQADSVAEITASLEELTLTVQSILENSQEVTIAANSALQQADAVRQKAGEVDTSSHLVEQAVGNSHEAATRTQERVETLAQQIQNIAGQSHQMAEITTFLNALAAETHVLAINAAIEAVTAGEEGDRFGVVAQQVRSLANQVTGNTNKIRGLLELLQANIENAANEAQVVLKEAAEVRKAEQLVTSGVQVLVENAHGAVTRSERIVETAQLTVALTGLIESAIKQHQEASLQVVSSLSEIQTAAGINNQASQLLENDSSRLEKLSQQLNLALSQVRLA